MQKTLGEKRVRTEFNISKNDIVDKIKQQSAELINLVDYIPHELNEGNERIRLKNIAMTKYEEAAMWAVKAATFTK